MILNETCKEAFAKAGFWPNEVMWRAWKDAWQQATKLEREACAKVCDTGNDSVVHPKYAEACRVSAALIRARSTQEKQE